MQTVRKKCPYLELFWSAFSRIWTEYGEIRSVSLHSARIFFKLYLINQFISDIIAIIENI